MNEFPRIVLGFHGCLEDRGSQLLSGAMKIENWPQSNDRWDWLGRGTYFWEHAPERALQWAKMKAKKDGGKPCVVGAVIQLGMCFDLTNVHYTDMLAASYSLLKQEYDAVGKQLPENTKLKPAAEDVQVRNLDCLVINRCLESAQDRRGISFQTVRGAFWEGGEVFPGSQIQKKSHIQIAVRDTQCIVGVFRPRLPDASEE